MKRNDLISNFVLSNQLKIENINNEALSFVFGSILSLVLSNDNNRFHVLMTSLCLLKSLDTTNQIMFHYSILAVHL
jgi:hypothetical protein